MARSVSMAHFVISEKNATSTNEIYGVGQSNRPVIYEASALPLCGYAPKWRKWRIACAFSSGVSAPIFLIVRNCISLIRSKNSANGVSYVLLLRYRGPMSHRLGNFARLLCSKNGADGVSYVRFLLNYRRLCYAAWTTSANG